MLTPPRGSIVLAFLMTLYAAIGPLTSCGLAAAQESALPDLGVGASFHGRRMFPDDNPWNQDISAAKVDPRSREMLASIGLDQHLHPDFGPTAGIPYVIVSGSTPTVPVQFQYADESDPGPYPIPANAPIEGGANAPADSDRHILIVDRDHWRLYELFQVFPPAKGQGWRAGSGAIFDLAGNQLRPAGWTSADAAGLPILPGLVRADEVFEQREIRHALRFTCRRTRRAYVPPATHWASRSKDPALPPMGMRVRLRQDFRVAPYPAPVQVILRALQKYGMILADNGSDFFITGAPDSRFDDEILAALKKVRGRDLEVVEMQGLVADR